MITVSSSFVAALTLRLYFALFDLLGSTSSSSAEAWSQLSASQSISVQMKGGLQ